MKFYRTTDPTTTSIVSIANCEEALGYSSGWHTNTLTMHLGAAVDYVEEKTDRAIYTQTWTGRGDCWPVNDASSFYLPKGSIASVTHVKYIKAGETDFTELTADQDYFVEINGDLCRIYPPDSGWPTDLNEDRKGVIEIVYVAGPSTAKDWAKSAVLSKTMDLELGQTIHAQHVDHLCIKNYLYFNYGING